MISFRASCVLSFPSRLGRFVILNRVLQTTKPLSISSNAHVARLTDICLRLPIRAHKRISLFPSFCTKGLLLHFRFTLKQIDLIRQLGIFVLKPLQFIIVS